MELRVLRYFLAVAQQHNFTKAAQQLMITQPTLSKQISDLERELGVRLFVRSHHNVTLTDEGRYLQDKAAQIVKLADQTKANISANQTVSGDITLGVGEGIGVERMMNVLNALTQDYPDITIHLVNGNASEMEWALDNGVVDFAVLTGQRPLEPYNYLQLPEREQWGVMMHKNDTLASKAALGPEDLVHRKLMVSQEALEEHRFKDWWGNLSSRMHIMGTFTLVFNAQMLIVKDQSCVITFDRLINGFKKDELTFRPLVPHITEPLTLMWQKNIAQSKAGQLFLRRLRSTLPEEVTD